MKSVIPLHILVADDEPKSVKYLTRALDGQNTQMHMATNGMEALDITLNHPLDAAILDLRMPEVGGLEACYKIRVVSPATRIIIYSAFLTNEMRESFTALNVSEMYEKPANIEDLISSTMNAANYGRKLWISEHNKANTRDEFMRGKISDHIIKSIPKHAELIRHHNTYTVRDEMIEATLVYFSGNISLTAKNLSLAKNTVRRWVDGNQWSYDPTVRKRISQEWIEVANYIARRSKRPNYTKDLPLEKDPEAKIKQDAADAFNLKFSPKLPDKEWLDLWDAWLMELAIKNKNRDDTIQDN